LTKKKRESSESEGSKESRELKVGRCLGFDLALGWQNYDELVAEWD